MTVPCACVARPTRGYTGLTSLIFFGGATVLPRRRGPDGPTPGPDEADSPAGPSPTPPATPPSMPSGLPSTPLSGSMFVGSSTGAGAGGRSLAAGGAAEGCETCFECSTDLGPPDGG